MEDSTRSEGRRSLRGQRSRATIVDVAALAGVSRSTASRALTGNGYVAAPVRERVLAAAAELKYVVDVMARSLKQPESMTIGVLVSDLRNPFYAQIAASIGESAREAGYTMVLADAGADGEQEIRAAKRFVAVRVRGVVATPLSPDVATLLDAYGVPLLEVDRQFAPESCDGVVVNNEEVAHRLTRLLVEAGHQRTALLIDETDWTTGRERRAGYERARRDAGLRVGEDLIVPTGWTETEARAATHRLLGRSEPPTAVFAANHLLAEGVYRAALERQLGVPTDLSLVSFDDAPWMSLVDPGITAVSQDVTELGRVAVQRLLTRFMHPHSPAATVVVGAHILQRGSVAPPR